MTHKKHPLYAPRWRTLATIDPAEIPVCDPHDHDFDPSLLDRQARATIRAREHAQ